MTKLPTVATTDETISPEKLLPEQEVQRTEYPKGEHLETNLNFRSAFEYARVGWAITRPHWLQGQYVFEATGGTFTAADKRTGQMGAFAVVRLPDGISGSNGDSFIPWQPTEADQQANDWIAGKRP